MTVVVVDDATLADLAAIRALEGLGSSTSRALGRDLVADGCCCLVARVDGEVAGFAAALLQVDEAHVLDVAVAPAQRRRGIARTLLRTLVARVRERGAVAVTLEVRPSNVGARALYRALGLVEEGRRRGYYPDGEDALLLWRRDLDDPAEDA